MGNRRREREHSGSAQETREDGEGTQRKRLAVPGLYSVPRSIGLAVSVSPGAGIVAVDVDGGRVVLPQDVPTQGIVRSDDDEFRVDVSGTFTEGVELDLG